ncbi:MAG: sigma-70 family RNA polymerase sigma factor [Actinomycetota bacterium]|nr:sigma-70 family RNA polymerase sigma factor [Actinomycetota bacterium]
MEALRRGDEGAFKTLVERYSPSLLRIAMMYTPSRAVAEDVVQETWLGVLNGLDRFEGRSSLKTWIFRILTNRAKTRGTRERRSIPFSAFADPAGEGPEPAVDPSRFYGADDRFPHGWVSFPESWDGVPEERLLSSETLERITAAIESLSGAQREVITLRDVEGWTSAEVCNHLGISETNQRVLLHRARAKVRRALEEYLAEERAPA